jgi:hypothetical protein
VIPGVQAEPNDVAHFVDRPQILGRATLDDSPCDYVFRGQRMRL